jgi:hypothetical protein
MRIALLLAVLVALPLPAFASAGGVAITQVYVYDRPQLSVFLVESNSTLICSWDITDYDESDTFSAQVVWTRDGLDNASETVDCGILKHCAAAERPKSALGEKWTCSVTVTDSYGGKGSGSADFQMTPVPLGFFGGWLRGLLSFFGLA